CPPRQGEAFGNPPSGPDIFRWVFAGSRRRTVGRCIFQAFRYRIGPSPDTDRQGPQRRQEMSFALNVIVKPAVIFICAAVLSLMLRRSSASARHAVWILAMAGAILLPVVSTFVPPIDFSVLPETSTNVVFLPLQQSSASTGAIHGATT